MIKDFYRILAVNSDATYQDIKRAFRNKALKYHPDVCKLPNANNLFIEIYEAFEILSDLDKRKKYDEIFLKKEQIIKVNKQPAEENFKDWTNNAKAKAENHSKMRYDEYKRNVFEEIVQTTKKTLSIGFIAILALLSLMGLFGFVKGLGQFQRHERDDTTFIIGLVFFILPAIPLIKSLISSNRKG